MPKPPTSPTPDDTFDRTNGIIGDTTADAINPTAPEAFEDKAQELVGMGIPATSLVVKVYRQDGAAPGTPGRFVGTVAYAEFGEELLSSRFGPGVYSAHLQTQDNRKRGTQKVARLEIAEDARAASSLAALAAPRTSAAPAPGGDFMQAFMLQIMQANQTTQIEAMKQQTAIMQALAARPGPDMSQMWTAVISIAPQLLELFSKRSGAGSTLGQVRELLDYIEDRRGEKPADESPLKWIVDKILPAFMDVMNKEPQASIQHQPRPQLPAQQPAQPAPTTADQPTANALASVPAVPPEALHGGQPAASSGPAEDPTGLAQIKAFGAAIAPMLRAAAILPKPHLDRFAETVWEIANAYQVVEMFDPSAPEGTLTNAIELGYEELKPVRETVLLPIERHLRRFAAEDAQAEKDEQSGQLRIADAIDTRTTDEKRRDSLAKARAARAAKKGSTAPEGQKVQ